MRMNSFSINLVKGQDKGFFDKFINWALTVGRLVVILTQLVALSAFLYRFSLDRRLIDLHDQISQKQAVVKLLKQKEDTYRNIQGRLALAATFIKTGQETTQIFSDILRLAPPDFIFNNIVVSQDIVRIDASVNSVSSLANFIRDIKSYKETSSVSLDRIENKTVGTAIVVSIAVRLKKTSKQNAVR